MEMENNLKKYKYIVYETTNLMNNKIYVGVHQTENPDIFDGYIGCGVIITQPYTYSNPKTRFQFAVKKYGPKNFRRKTLAIFDTAEEAYLFEEDIVNENFLKRNDVYNMILGGSGGCLISQRIKVYQYDLNGKYISEYNSFAEAALQMNCDYTLISYAVRKKAIGVKSFWSTDKVAQLDLNDYNVGDNHKIKVSCYSSNGSFIKTYDSISQAKIETGILNNRIVNSCNTFELVNNLYFLYIEGVTYSDAKTEWIKIRPVYKYDNNGKFIEEYESQTIAEKLNPGSNISKSIKLKSIDKNGFIWGLQKLKNYNVPEKNDKKQVGKFDLEGNLVKTYDSATAAAKENGTSVWKVLAGTNKTHKKHVYKYL